jgi:hypothetical protein
MAKMKQESIVDFLHCASILEERAYSLYKNLADKVNLPLVNSLLLHIAYDSRKHSVTLKGITESIAKPKKQPKDYEKKLFFGRIWTVIERLAKEIAKEQRIPKESMTSLVKKLMLLESTVGEEYYILVQLKTLQYMTREIQRGHKRPEGYSCNHNQRRRDPQKTPVKNEEDSFRKRRTDRRYSNDSKIQKSRCMVKSNAQFSLRKRSLA